MHTHLTIYIYIYIYSTATCTKFDLCQTFQNVTTVYGGECLYLYKIIMKKHSRTSWIKETPKLRLHTLSGSRTRYPSNGECLRPNGRWSLLCTVNAARILRPGCHGRVAKYNTNSASGNLDLSTHCENRQGSFVWWLCKEETFRQKG